MNILVLAAHPDDEVLGMGGTIKKFTKIGFNVKIVIFATGISARRSSNYKNTENYDVDDNTISKMNKQIEKLKIDARSASKVLGVSDIEFLDFPDNEMDLISNLEITKSIEKIIKKFKPDQVFTHSGFDVNIDHRMLYNATLAATRPKFKSKIKKVYSFEVPSSTEWYFPSQFSPNFFVNIDNEIKSKILALKKYKTELNQFPHPRSTIALDAIGKKWGSVSGFKHAEAFTLIRELND
ncbi:MAG: GlcNAc-PI de-N-acetylase [Chloroflexi bacterium]|nr:GlcNAc-PI de-N-acetylase [Chloroflexota bacterium]|tara:strand:+ start:1053 stop:1766 length:714 start_codon:yes stop_codon:yes gene_type:complete